jgi:NAD(P)-dependent dehydrogenase (short-subunit alcohol dehydrogenase family)
MDINVKGAFLVSKAVAEVMENQESGKVIFTISMAGKCGSPLYAHYNSSKAALLTYMQALAMELAPNILVNGVCPGVVKTSMQEREIKWCAELQGISEDLVQSPSLSGVPLSTCTFRGTRGCRKSSSLFSFRRWRLYYWTSN